LRKTSSAVFLIKASYCRPKEGRQKMVFAIIGFLMSFLSPLLRSVCLPRDFELLSRHFCFLLTLSILGNISALFGFHYLASCHAITNGNYRSVLEILALLSAGAIAGFWGVEYQDFEPDETHFLNVISALFVLVFYSLFFSICFYIGESEELQHTPWVSWIVPGIMMLILHINAVIDILDYRK
jgi:hypothetical protein